MIRALGQAAPPDARAQPASRTAPGRGPAGWPGQLARFVLVGMTCTAAYVLLYLVLRGATGAQAANAVSLLTTAIANTALNRRVTFGIRGRRHAARHQVRGLIAFGIGLSLTSAGLMVLHAALAAPSHGSEVAVLLLANLAAGVVRFVLYQRWVFRGPDHQPFRRAGRSDAQRVSPRARSR